MKKLRLRRLNRLYACLWGYFWLPCPICRQMFGGHEVGHDSLMDGPGHGWGVCWVCSPEALARNISNGWR